MKTAVVHDWLVTYAGAERALENVLAIYPEADLFSLLDFLPSEKRAFIRHKPVRTSFLQHIPFARSRHRSLLPLMPFAIERFDLSGYDVIISSSHAVAKGVRINGRQVHICYCHTPMRYAWDLREQYLKEAGLHKGLKGLLAGATLNRIRNWDRRTADRVSHFIANSRYIAERINRAYGRTAHVVYPPVDTNLFTLHREKEDFYLAVSRMVPYKRMDVIVEAFANMPDKRLLVIGEGPESAKVREKAAGARNVQILGYRPLEEMRDYMQRARAFVFAAEEDFGIVAVEAQACGTPVIAYGKGGASETVIPGRTGVFFEEQSSESLSRAVEYFEHARKDMDPEEIRRHAEKFSAERFRMEFRDYVENCLSRRGLS